jgi:hypothetical protein
VVEERGDACDDDCAGPGTERLDAAGWVLGVLDPEDAWRFAGHLTACPECQRVVADLEPVARVLRATSPR